MKISLVVFLATVLGALSLAYGRQRWNNYSPYFDYNQPSDPFYSKGRSSKIEWGKASPPKWPTYKKEMEWKGQRKYPSFGHWPSKWYSNSPNSPTAVPKWKKNSLRVWQSSKTTVGSQAQPEGAIPFVPLTPRPNLNLDRIQWPDYLPPITQIKPRLDDPPEALY